MTQVAFYGSLQKAGTVLACVQACIENVAKDISRTGASGRPILQRYLAELEEIETDVVTLLNEARASSDSRDDRDSSWPEGPSNGVV